MKINKSVIYLFFITMLFFGASASAVEDHQKNSPYAVTGVADQFLDVSTQALPALRALALNVFYLFVTLELILFGFMTAFGQTQDWVPKLAGKIFLFGIVFAVIQYWGPILDLLFDACIYIGAKAGMIKDPLGGSSFDWAMTMVQNPSAIITQGLITTAQLFGQMNIVTKIVTQVGGVWGFLLVGIMLCYGAIAIQIFITVVEFYLISSLMLVFIPMSTLKYTRFISDKMIQLLVNMGLKLIMVTFLLGLIQPLLIKTLPANAGIGDLFQFFLMLCCVIFLIWHAPHLVIAVVNSNPGLAHHQATGMAMGATMMMTNAITRLTTAIKSGGTSEAVRSSKNLVDKGTGGKSGVNIPTINLSETKGPSPSPLRNDPSAPGASQQKTVESQSIQQTSKTTTGTSSVVTAAPTAQSPGQSTEAIQHQAENEQKPEKKPDDTNTQQKPQTTPNSLKINTGSPVSPLQGDPDAPGKKGA